MQNAAWNRLTTSGLRAQHNNQYTICVRLMRYFKICHQSTIKTNQSIKESVKRWNRRTSFNAVWNETSWTHRQWQEDETTANSRQMRWRQFADCSIASTDDRQRSRVTAVTSFHTSLDNCLRCWLHVSRIVIIGTRQPDQFVIFDAFFCSGFVSCDTARWTFRNRLTVVNDIKYTLVDSRLFQKKFGCRKWPLNC